MQLWQLQGRTALCYLQQATQGQTNREHEPTLPRILAMRMMMLTAASYEAADLEDCGCSDSLPRGIRLGLCYHPRIPAAILLDKVAWRNSNFGKQPSPRRLERPQEKEQPKSFVDASNEVGNESIGRTLAFPIAEVSPCTLLMLSAPSTCLINLNSQNSLWNSCQQKRCCSKAFCCTRWPFNDKQWS